MQRFLILLLAGGTLIMGRCTAHDASSSQQHAYDTPSITTTSSGNAHDAEPTHPLEAMRGQPRPETASHIRSTKIADMQLSELYQARNLYLWNRNIDTAIKAIERILFQEEDQDLRPYYMLEVGDLYMEKANYPMALSVYDTFIQQYPGSQFLAYAHYRTVLCHYYSMLPPDKDQEHSRNMIEAANSYLTQFPHGKRAHEVRTLRDYGYKQLCLSELHTCEIYIGKSIWSNRPAAALRAAYYRLKYIYEHLSEHLAHANKHAVQETLAKTIQNVHITNLSEDNHEAIAKVYQQLTNAHEQIHKDLEEAPSTNWFVNPLRRF